jgi:hypothetical protein
MILRWYQRNTDGFWNAVCSCGSTLVGNFEHTREIAEQLHFEDAAKERNCGCGVRHRPLPCGRVEDVQQEESDPSVWAAKPLWGIRIGSDLLQNDLHTGPYQVYDRSELETMFSAFLKGDGMGGHVELVKIAEWSKR